MSLVKTNPCKYTNRCFLPKDLSMECEDADADLAGSSFVTEEGGRGCRSKKRQVDPTYCPVCSLTLRSNEVDTHLQCEIDKLNKIPSTKVRTNGKSVPGSSSNGGSSSQSSDKNWVTYQKVKTNRQGRQRTKIRKRKLDETVCPVCNKEVTEEINSHLELCLRRSEANSSESDENIDVENYEEYEWAGQLRVRSTSLFQGGISNLGSTISTVDDDEDLNVDGDESQKYGAPQYTELDVILPCGEQENTALRKAVLGTEPKRISTSPGKTSEESSDLKTNGDPVLEVLKNRIKELEQRDQHRDEIYKCLICMERYRTPVISTCCWHVHCEECWLQTLGAKKLCPQCNMITSPADLRRIYM